MLRLTVEDAVARLTLDRPAKRNALSPELLRGLIDACGEIATRDDVRAVVLSGAGGTFSGGADLLAFMAEIQGSDPLAVADLGRRATEALADLPQPTLAMIQGACVGGGIVLAAACDIAIATRTARFRLPELELGIPLGWGGTTRLVRAFGPRVTAELVLSCRWFDAEEARELGLVARIVQTDEIDAVTAELARSLAARPRWVVEVTKRQIRRAIAGTPDDASDAVALLEALDDPECQAAAATVLGSKPGVSRT